MSMTIQLSMSISKHDMGHKAKRATKKIGKDDIFVTVFMRKAEMNRLDADKQNEEMFYKATDFVSMMGGEDRMFSLTNPRYGSGRFTAQVMEVL